MAESLPTCLKTGCIPKGAGDTGKGGTCEGTRYEDEQVRRVIGISTRLQVVEK